MQALSKNQVLRDGLCEMGNNRISMDASTWLIEVQWRGGATGRISPTNVCRVKSVPFIE